jgi:predicted Fe-Mo cluster-binding NifX family protein
MLIAITSDGADLDSLVAEKFGRTSFLIFYDTEKNTFESLRNPYANLFGGGGIQTAQFIIEKNASVVITINIGFNPLRLLMSAEVKVYYCSLMKVNEAIEKFIEKKLIIIENVPFNDFGRKRYGRKRKNQNKNN